MADFGKEYDQILRERQNRAVEPVQETTVTEQVITEGFGTDESVAEELILFVDNDAQLYKQQFIPIIKNILRKRKRGVYDHSKAPKLWLYLMDNAAKKYAKEHGEPGARWMDMFPKNIRRLAAQMKADREWERIEGGEYDHLMESLTEQSFTGETFGFEVGDRVRVLRGPRKGQTGKVDGFGAAMGQRGGYDIWVEFPDREQEPYKRNQLKNLDESINESIHGDPHAPHKSLHPKTISDALASMDDSAWNEMTQAVFNTPGDQVSEEVVLQKIIETNKVDSIEGLLEFWIDESGAHTVLVHDLQHSIDVEALAKSSEGWSNDDVMKKRGMGSMALRMYERFTSLPPSYVTSEEAGRLLKQSVDMVREHEGEQSAKILEVELAILWGMRKREGTVTEQRIKGASVTVKGVDDKALFGEFMELAKSMGMTTKRPTAVREGGEFTFKSMRSAENFAQEMAERKLDTRINAWGDGKTALVKEFGKPFKRFTKSLGQIMGESITEVRGAKMPSELFIVKDEVDKTVYGVFKDKDMAFMLAKQKTRDLRDEGRIHDAKVFRVSKPRRIASFVDIAHGGAGGALVVQTDLFESISEQVPDVSDELRMGTYEVWTPEIDEWAETHKQVRVRPGESIAAITNQLSAQEGTQVRVIIFTPDNELVAGV